MLDYVTGELILKILRKTSRDTGKTVIVITHTFAIAKTDGSRAIHIRNGQVSGMERNAEPLGIEKIEWRFVGPGGGEAL